MGSSTIPKLPENWRFSGPLPSPQDLAEYEQILPGVSEKLLRLVEERQKHRLEVEKAVVSHEASDARWRLIVALTFTLVSFLAGVYLSLRRVEFPATVLFCGSIAMWTVTFVTSRKPRKREMLQESSFDDEVDPENDEKRQAQTKAREIARSEFPELVRG